MDLCHEKSSITKRVINDNNFTYINLLKILKEITKERFDKKISALDIGCGTGTISLYLAEKDNSVTGIDISKKAIKIARENAKRLHLENVTFFNEDIQSFNFNQKFDLVICSEVLEHLSHDIKVLKKIRKLMKKDGHLLISVPSTNAPLYRWGLAKTFDKKVGHIRRYNLDSLMKTLIKLNFKIIKTEKSEGLLRNSLFIFDFLGKIIRFIRGPLVNLFTFFDRIFINLLGESQIFIVLKCQ